MDGQAVEDDDVWCPGVVCASASSAASSPAERNGGDGGVASPGGLVVDVMGQSKVEFAVGTDNLTGFPGYGDNLEAFRHSVATGLVSFFFYPLPLDSIHADHFERLCPFEI